jgi:hypothetical protein
VPLVPSEGPLFSELQCSYWSSPDLWQTNSWMSSLKTNRPTIPAHARTYIYIHAHTCMGRIPETKFSCSEADGWLHVEFFTITTLVHKQRLPTAVIITRMFSDVSACNQLKDNWRGSKNKPSDETGTWFTQASTLAYFSTLRMDTKSSFETSVQF